VILSSINKKIKNIKFFFFFESSSSIKAHILNSDHEPQGN
jgi:hypothetical protein